MLDLKTSAGYRLSIGDQELKQFWISLELTDQTNPSQNARDGITRQNVLEVNSLITPRILKFNTGKYLPATASNNLKALTRYAEKG